MVSLFIFTYSSTWPNEKSQPKLKATLGSRFFRRSCSREEQKPAKRRPRHSPARLPGVRLQRVTPEPSPSPLPGPVSYGRAPRALCPQPPGPWTVRPRPPGSPPAQGLARCWFRRHPSGSISFSPCHRHTRGSGAVASQHVGSRASICSHRRPRPPPHPDPPRASWRLRLEVKPEATGLCPERTC